MVSCRRSGLGLLRAWVSSDAATYGLGERQESDLTNPHRSIPLGSFNTSVKAGNTTSCRAGNSVRATAAETATDKLVSLATVRDCLAVAPRSRFRCHFGPGRRGRTLRTGPKRAKTPKTHRLTRRTARWQYRAMLGEPKKQFSLTRRSAKYAPRAKANSHQLSVISL